MSSSNTGQVVTNIMKAIRVHAFGGAEKLQLETAVPRPTPAANEVLIKVLSAGVNPVDTYIRSGNYSRLPALPYTPGQDSAGVVEAVGSETEGFKPGDRVYTINTTSGAYAEYTTAPPKFVGRLHDNLSFTLGASIGVPYYTAYKALHIRAQAKPGQVVLVHGASGSVGTAAIQMGKAFGLTMIGTAGSKEGMDLVTNNGADMVFNHREDGYIQKIQAAVGGVDIVLEMLSNVNLQNDLQIVNYGGKIMVIGCRGTIEINPRLTMGKESQIMGVALMASSDAEWKEMHAAVQAGQRSGWLVPQVAKVYPLSEAAQAQTDVIENQATTGKLVIDPTK